MYMKIAFAPLQYAYKMFQMKQYKEMDIRSYGEQDPVFNNFWKMFK